MLRNLQVLVNPFSIGHIRDFTIRRKVWKKGEYTWETYYVVIGKYGSVKVLDYQRNSDGEYRLHEVMVFAFRNFDKIEAAGPDFQEERRSDYGANLGLTTSQIAQNIIERNSIGGLLEVLLQTKVNINYAGMRTITASEALEVPYPPTFDPRRFDLASFEEIKPCNFVATYEDYLRQRLDIINSHLQSIASRELGEIEWELLREELEDLMAVYGFIYAVENELYFSEDSKHNPVPVYSYSRLAERVKNVIRGRNNTPYGTKVVFRDYITRLKNSGWGLLPREVIGTFDQRMEGLYETRKPRYLAMLQGRVWVEEVLNSFYYTPQDIRSMIIGKSKGFTSLLELLSGFSPQSFSQRTMMLRLGEATFGLEEGPLRWFRNTLLRWITNNRSLYPYDIESIYSELIGLVESKIESQ
jgi:hypothetical protein